MTYSKLLHLHRLIDASFLHASNLEAALEAPVVRIGPDYQVVIPELRNQQPPEDGYEDNSDLVWQPDPGRISDQEVTEYLNVAEVLGYEAFRALSILYRLDYNLNAALQELIRSSEYRLVAVFLCNVLGLESPEIPTGPNHQVLVPEFIGDNPPPDDYPEDSSLIWKPDPGQIDDQSLEKYLRAANKLRCDELHALKVLYQCGYNTTAALAELEPLPLTHFPLKQMGFDSNNPTRTDESRDAEALLLWKPDPSHIDDQSLERYLKESSQNGCGTLEALSMLYSCEYNASAALALIRQFVVT